MKGALESVRSCFPGIEDNVLRNLKGDNTVVPHLMRDPCKIVVYSNLPWIPASAGKTE